MFPEIPVPHKREWSSQTSNSWHSSMGKLSDGSDGDQKDKRNSSEGDKGSTRSRSMLSDGSKGHSKSSWRDSPELDDPIFELTQLQPPRLISLQDEDKTVKLIFEKEGLLNTDPDPLSDLTTPLNSLDLDTDTSHSLLSKYFQTTTQEGSAQVGTMSSWEWLGKMEQLLLQFFLTIFESKGQGQGSKLLMDMIPEEARSQIKNIFQLLVNTEPERHKDLSYLVKLAENWLIHKKGDLAEEQNMLEFIRMYLQRVESQEFCKLPIHVRLHKLGAFIVSLKEMSKGGPGLPVGIKYPIEKKVEPPVLDGDRAASPRVKPATHFSHVVANILGGRPCNDPLPFDEVYADKLGENTFKDTLHGDEEFKTYTDQKYGDLLKKGELFKEKGALIRSPAWILSGPVKTGTGQTVQYIRHREKCVGNKGCWLPIYTKNYLQAFKMEGGDTGCGRLVKATRGMKSKLFCVTKTDAKGTGPCKPVRSMPNATTRKLYDWVRGPDGKVYRREVGSYTELGATSSLDIVLRHQKRKPRRSDPQRLEDGMLEATFGHSRLSTRHADRLIGKYKRERDSSLDSSSNWSSSTWSTSSWSSSEEDFDMEGEDAEGEGRRRRSSRKENEHRHSSGKEAGEEEGPETKRKSHREEIGEEGHKEMRGDHLGESGAHEEEHPRQGSRRHTGKKSGENEAHRHSHRSKGKSLEEKEAHRHSKRSKGKSLEGAMEIEMKEGEPGKEGEIILEERGSQIDAEGGHKEGKAKSHDAHETHLQVKHRESKRTSNRDRQKSHKGEEGHEGDEGHIHVEGGREHEEGDGQEHVRFSIEEQGHGLGEEGLVHHKSSHSHSHGQGEEVLGHRKSSRSHRHEGLGHHKHSHSHEGLGHHRHSHHHRQSYGPDGKKHSHHHHHHRDGRVSTRASNVHGSLGHHHRHSARKSGKDEHGHDHEDENEDEEAGHEGYQYEDGMGEKRNSLGSKGEGHRRGTGEHVEGGVEGQGGKQSTGSRGQGRKQSTGSRGQGGKQSTGSRGHAGGDDRQSHLAAGSHRRGSGGGSSRGHGGNSESNRRSGKRSKHGDVGHGHEGGVGDSHPQAGIQLHETGVPNPAKASTGHGSSKSKDHGVGGETRGDRGLSHEGDHDHRVSARESKGQRMSGKDGHGGKNLSHGEGAGTGSSHAHGEEGHHRLTGGSHRHEHDDEGHGHVHGSHSAGHEGKGHSRGSGGHEHKRSHRRHHDGEGDVHEGDSPTGKRSLSSDESQSDSELSDGTAGVHQTTKGRPGSAAHHKSKDGAHHSHSVQVLHARRSLTSPGHHRGSTTETYVDLSRLGSASQQEGILAKGGRYLKAGKAHGQATESSSSWARESGQLAQRMERKKMMLDNLSWERASKVLKKPSKAFVVPPPENLMLHLANKFPKANWGKGEPVASRSYPNGKVFVSQYANGGSQVYYPHGGLAIAISGPSPVTSEVLIVRDPSDHYFFFDKALLAELNSSGRGTIYGDNGAIKAEYSTFGGFKVDDGLGKARRWQWNKGGQRLVMKLNKFVSIRMSDHDKVFLNYYGNRRGFLVNVASGGAVSLMNKEEQSESGILRYRKFPPRRSMSEDTFDYARGRFSPRAAIGFLNERNWGGGGHGDSDSIGGDDETGTTPCEDLPCKINPFCQYEVWKKSFCDTVAESLAHCMRQVEVNNCSNTCVEDDGSQFCYRRDKPIR